MKDTDEIPLRPSGSQDGVTLQGSVVGSVAYAPPEQLRGDLESVTERSDVYGLGAILYELLTKKTAGAGDTLEQVMRQVQKGEIESPRLVIRAIPKALEAICLNALSRVGDSAHENSAALYPRRRRVGSPDCPDPATLRRN